MVYFFAWLLDPIARALATILLSVSGAAVTVTPGGTGCGAWSDHRGWCLRVGELWLEVDRV